MGVEAAGLGTSVRRLCARSRVVEAGGGEEDRVKQRISVAIHLAAAQEIAHALDISVATDPRREA